MMGGESGGCGRRRATGGACGGGRLVGAGAVVVGAGGLTPRRCSAKWAERWRRGRRSNGRWGRRGGGEVVDHR